MSEREREREREQNAQLKNNSGADTLENERIETYPPGEYQNRVNHRFVLLFNRTGDDDVYGSSPFHLYVINIR